MTNRSITQETIQAFQRHLEEQERSRGTIEKYLRDVRLFAAWLGDRALCREAAAGWKNDLLAKAYAPVTINSMLASLNGYFRFSGLADCRTKFLKIQRRTFRDKDRELTRAEYERLREKAYQLGRERLGLLMETMCASGIRVSEVPYITVEAAQKGRADISLKGKIRTVLIPRKLCQKLVRYAKKQKIASGEIFLTKSGKRLSRGQIWAEMKRLCQKAGVKSEKVFPHNLRHLFARAFYKVCKDIVMLADILGHSSAETTRTYLITTGREHQTQMEKLNLVSWA